MKRNAWLLGALGAAGLMATGCGGAGGGGVGGGTGGGARAEIAVTDRGFEPSEIQAKRGVPVTLVVTRKTDATCVKEIVMADRNFRADLPLNEPVEVTFTPSEAGELRFACGMDMIAGKVIVR
jgi:plastocyanin domain-containing protein